MKHGLKRFLLDGPLKVYECVCGERIADSHPDIARAKFKSHAPGFTAKRR